MLKIICDVHIPKSFVESLKEASFDVIWIAEYNPTMTDEEIINFANKEGAVILTEDSDFGRLLFFQKIKIIHNIIYIRRYQKALQKDIEEKTKHILTLLQGGVYQGSLITITEKGIRTRKQLNT